MKQKRQLSLDSNLSYLKDKYTMAKCHKPGHCPPDVTRSDVTRSAVTEEARRVLEQFLKRSLSQNDASPIRHQYQLKHDVIPEEDGRMDTVDGHNHFLQPPSNHKPLKKSVTPDYIRSDSYRAAATQGALIKDSVQRKSQTLPLSAPKRQSSRESSSPSRHSSKGSSSLQSSSASYGRPHAPQSPVSYSTGDEGYSDNSDNVDASGAFRKKKSFFKRASERLRQSFRIQNSRKDECVHDEGAGRKQGKNKKKRKEKSKSDSSSDKSKSPDSYASSHVRTPRDQDMIYDGNSVLMASNSFEGTIDTLDSSRGTIGSSDNRHDQHVMNKKMKTKDSPESHMHAADETNAWDRLLYHIRKKGQKLRRRLAKEDSFNRRSKSAEPLGNFTTPPKSADKPYNFCTDDSQHSKDDYTNTEKQKLAAVIETWRGAHDVQKGAHDVRKGLRLDGLSQCRPSSPDGTPDGEIQGFDEVGERLIPGEIRSRGISQIGGGSPQNKPRSPSRRYRPRYAYAASSASHGRKVNRLSSQVEADNVDLDETDNAGFHHDGKSGLLSGSVSDKPFHERSDNEKEELFEKVAQKLAAIADNYNTVAGSPSPVDSSVSDLEAEGGQTATVVRVPSLEKKIAACLRSRGDVFSETQPLATGAISDILKHATYTSFKQVVNKEIGNEPGVQQLATLFQITKSAVQLAGTGGDIAVRVKENALRYFEDKFATWIVGKGGWESMIDESDADSEVD